MNFLDKLKLVFTGLEPFIELAATCFFPPASPLIAIAKKIVTVTPQLMDVAQTTFGTGTGDRKLEFVMDGLEKTSNVIVETMQDISTGKQKETWDELAPFVKMVVGAAKAGSKLVEPQKLPDNLY